MSIETETNPVADDNVVTPGVEADTTVDLRDTHPDNRPAPEADPDDETGEADTSEAGTEADDEEEVDYGGKKYRIPKALAAERLMQADYTRKTTAHAETVRAWEAERVAAVEADEAERETQGKVYHLKGLMAQFDQIDWRGLNVADAAEAQALWFEREQTKAALAEAEGGLQQKSAERLQSQQATLATAMQEAGRVLASDKGIKGWSPALANEIAEYGVASFGIQPSEIQQMSDPRVWKLLHGHMTLARQLKAQAGGARQAAIQQVEPAKKVVARSAPSATGLDDKLGGAEWQRRREAQLAAKNT